MSNEHWRRCGRRQESHLVDTSQMSIAEVVEHLLELIRRENLKDKASSQH